MRFLKLPFFLGLIAISSAVVVGWMNSARLVGENRLLIAELASIRSGQETKPQQDRNELSKTELDELRRLRREAEQLRIQKKELDQLRSENERLRESLESEKDASQARWKSRVSELRTNEINAADFLGIVPEMAEALTNGDPFIRIEAARVLRRIGLDRMLNTNLTAQDFMDLKAAAMAAAPDLVPVLKDPDPLVRANAAITLGFLHEDLDEVIPALVQNLNSDLARDAGSSAKALMRLQGDAKSAVPALMPLTQSPDPDLRQLAIDAVKEIDPAAARNAGFE